jgi:hypothetical protein
MMCAVIYSFYNKMILLLTIIFIHAKIICYNQYAVVILMYVSFRTKLPLVNFYPHTHARLSIMHFLKVLLLIPLRLGVESTIDM